MRLAKNKDRFKERALATGVANLTAEGKLSIRSAAALLAKQRPRGKPPKPKGDEGIGSAWLKGLAPDETIHWLRELHDAEWQQEFTVKWSKPLPSKAPPQSEFLRRPLTPTTPTPTP